MIASQLLGDVSQLSDQCEYLTLAFSPLRVPLHSRWRNNGLSADFVGDYVTTFLPAEYTMVSPERQTEVRHIVTYIANELLENAMKYHDRDLDMPIGLRLELADDHITVIVTNGVHPEQAQRYRAFVEQLLQEDARDLIVRRLEDTAAGDGTKMSCLGLLTMINDYGAKLSWRFENHAPGLESMTVTTRAILPLKHFLGVPA